MSMSHALSVAAHTLGCKVNQCDTEALLSQLKNMGFVVRNFNEMADIYIINTCTVTHVSDRKSRQMIRRARRMNPTAFVAVCGCMVENKPDDVADVDFIFDARKPDDFFEFLTPMTHTTNHGYDSKPDIKHKLRTRAFIKIQDGCNRFCSYCIVPYVRGALQSRPVTDILDEAAKLVKLGGMEIVLTGIQVASYGDDTGDANLASLIRQIAKLDGLKRLRLSSIDPWAVDEDFLDAVATADILCDHFHLSLQSGCDTTLARMNRRYTIAQYRLAAAALRNLRPNCAMTTDIIVGFPGETDADFLESYAFVHEIGFAQVHVFEFSPREGTPAAGFDGQVPQKVKNARGLAMRELAAHMRKHFLEAQVGKMLPVLFETKTNGHSTNYCPVEVFCNTCNDELTNTIQNVEIIACTASALTGRITN